MQAIRRYHRNSYVRPDQLPVLGFRMIGETVSRRQVSISAASTVTVRAKVGQTLTIPEEAGKQYRLHPVHTAHDAADRRAGSATYDSASGRFTLPPRTTVVFVVR